MLLRCEGKAGRRAVQIARPSRCRSIDSNGNVTALLYRVNYWSHTARLCCSPVCLMCEHTFAVPDLFSPFLAEGGEKAVHRVRFYVRAT